MQKIKFLSIACFNDSDFINICGVDLYNFYRVIVVECTSVFTCYEKEKSNKKNFKIVNKTLHNLLATLTKVL